jgi:Ca2+-transporting ATPase
VKKIAYYKLSSSEVLKELNTSRSGLSLNEAKNRLEQYGLNELVKKKDLRFIKIFLKQVANPLVYILFIAALISLISNHASDAIVILAVILINSIIGFIQEYRAERSIEALKSLLVLKSKVLRDGELYQIDAKELVPGDVILIEEGDKIPADARLIEARNLQVIESSITGESIPSEKNINELNADLSIADRKNYVFMGTIVSSGNAVAVITGTGSDTIIGEIASSIQNIKETPTHFEIITRKLARQMATLAIVGAILLFLIGLSNRELSFQELFLFSIASLVSAIPEGLPTVLTVVLAIGARRMAMKKAIVRNLKASETLGIVNVIATDKTGTLTQNTMTIEEIYLSDNKRFSVSGEGWSNIGDFINGKEVISPQSNKDLYDLIITGFLASSAKLMREGNKVTLIGDPTEAAFVVLGEKAGLDFGVKEHVIFELPFNSNHKFRGSLIDQDENNKLLVIGAPEKILSISTLSHDKQTVIKQEVSKLSQKGLRVIALASKTVGKKINEFDHDDVSEVEFIGLVGMKDPIRLEAKAAIKKAYSAGIRVMMLTGDHSETAISIAKDLEFRNLKAITETDLEKLTHKEFAAAVQIYDIFARLNPQMKLRIAETLQKKGYVVAMTGDGVNDAPALKQADIGISMGNIGTDTARESSEIVLSDDNFASIVDAVEEGRIIFNNIRKAATTLVTTNVAEQFTILTTILLGFPLPLLAPQILWLNLVTDSINNIALAMEKSHGNVLNAKPKKKQEGILNKSTILFVVLMSVMMLILTLIFFIRYLPEGIEKARSVAFLCMSFTQIFNTLNFRSFTKSIFQIGVFSNKFLVISFIVSTLLTFIAIYSPFFQRLLQFESVDFGVAIVIFAASSLTLFAGEIIKWRRRTLEF